MIGLMQSPLGSHKGLERVELERGLIAFRCPETGGHWIPAENYWRWQSTQTAVELADDPPPSEVPVSEFDEVVKLCPESGTVMMRYRVGHGRSFRVDRSRTGGIWLDGGEWEALKAGNLHLSIHRIFTSPWQKAVRHQVLDETLQTQLRERLGEDLLTRLLALRKELAAHPHREAALAFLHGG
jgi:Zn-finger nucleic acid-binding protein